MRKYLFKNVVFYMLALVLFGVFIFPAVALASDGGNYEDPGWETSERMDRIFYFVHGTSVWGHEFGFFKSPENCNIDTLWMTFSSYEDGIEDFTGKDIDFDFIIDEKKYRVSLNMMSPFTIGLTNVVTFTNFILEDAVMLALIEGDHLDIEVAGPKEVMGLFDIKKDEFNLEELSSVRAEALSACRERAPAPREGGLDLAMATRRGTLLYEE